MNKRYWLRGLLIGFVVYFLSIIVMLIISAFVYEDGWGLYLLPSAIGRLWPQIFLGLFLGWLYGKIKNRNKSI